MPLFNNFHSARNQGQQGFSVEAVAYEAEFKELLHRFQDRHHETDFDPVAPFRRIVEILEWAMDDFYANNPDPLDQRHPHKIIPTCLYGHLLRFMLKFSDFLDKCLVSYIMPHHNNLELNILAARVLVMALPVIDSSVFSVDADVHQQLFRYALDSESRELRAYATAILNPAITPETAHVFRTEIVDLITKSLNSLKVLYAQMVENSTENSLNEGGTDRAAPTDFSQLAENLNKEQENGKTEKKTDSDDKAIKKDLDGKETKTDADGKVPDTSSSNSETEKSKENGQTGGNVETGKLRSGQKRTSDDAKLSVCEAALKKIKASGRRKSTPKNPGASTPLADFGEESRSSTVDEMKRVFVGNNKVYPLTIEMEQRMILGFLQCAFEFTDNVSVLTEHSALDVILKYLNVNEYHDIRLLFEALFALSSMLIHLRLAWDFVNRGGILRLITVNRNSVAAAAVCVCFHHISQFDEIMEHICQGSSKGVDDVVSYAIWQLAHGYESVGGRICVFFQYALRYKNVLERFDHRDGLRVLYNYANSKLNDFLYGDFEDNEVIEKIQEKMGEYCQVLRNTNVCLTQYILSHILLKYEHIKRMHADRFPSYLKKAVLAGKIPHKDLCKKPLIMDAETESKALEVLRYFIPATNLTFHPLTNIRSFGFITLYIRAMALRTEFYHHMSLLKSDVIQGILKIFQYATVSPAVVQDLATAISFPHGDRCGIRVLLELIDADPMEEAQHVKLSLQVLANCFCGVDVSTAKRATEPANSNEITSKKHLKPLPSFHEIEHKIENVMKSAWDAAQENNALMTLIHYIQIDEPFTDADAIHVVACRALNGLAKSEQIRQILSKLPLIADNELAVLTRGPVLQDKAADHAEFVKEARKLIGTVHQTEVDATTEDLTYDKMVKAKVIKQTKIDFDQVGLQRLIHDYLIQAGLDKTAQTLQVEAGLEAGYSGGTAVTPRTVATPRRLGELKKSAESESTSADRTINSVTSLRTDTASTLNSKESFSKPTVSARKSLGSMGKPNGKLMSNRRLSTFSTTSTSSPSNRRTMKSSLLAQSSLPFSNRHLENAISMTEKQVPLKPYNPLTDIVTDYFRNQHAHCEHPVVTCPPFSFYYPHRCPKPRDLFRAPVNLVDRFFHSQAMPYRNTHTMFNRANRNLAFSHYCPVDLFDMEEETLTACAFSYDDSFIHLGTYSGDVHWMSVATGRSESSANCHNTFITSVQHSTDGTMLLTSSVYVPPLSALWRTGETQEEIHTFADDMDMSFSHVNNDRIIGTQMHAANIYDTEIGELLHTLSDTEVANRYQGLLRNKAVFNYTDNLALNDGILWDVRAANRAQIVRKYDKFSNEYCGKFHPNGHEVIISGSVWDIRTHQLLRHVAALDNCDYFFNNSGDVIFSVLAKEQPVRDDQFFSAYESNFRVIDSFDYHVITTVDTKRDIAGFAIDHADKFICTIERSRTSDEPSMCRIYEIGKPAEFAGEDENDDEDDDNNDDDDDDDEIFSDSSVSSSEDGLRDEDDYSEDSDELVEDMLAELAGAPGFEDYEENDDEVYFDDEDGDPDPDEMSDYYEDYNENSDDDDEDAEGGEDEA